MGYRMSEEWMRPGQSRFIDLLKSSGQEYRQQLSDSSARQAQSIKEGGMAYGQGIASGITGGAEGALRGYQKGKENRLAEEQMALQKAAGDREQHKFEADYGRQDDPLTMGYDEGSVGRLEKDRLDTIAQNKAMSDLEKRRLGHIEGQAQYEREKETAAARKQTINNALIAAQEMQNLTPDQIEAMGYGKMQPVRMPDGSVLSPQQAIYSKNIKDIQQKYNLSDEQLQGSLGAAKRAASISSLTEQSLKQNTEDFKLVSEASAEARNVGESIKDLKDLAGKFSQTMPVGPTSSTRKTLEGKLLAYMDKYDPAGADEYRSSIMLPGWQQPSGYMKQKTEQMIQNAKQQLRNKIAGLKPQLQNDPGLQQALAALEQQDLGLNPVTKQPRKTAAKTAAFNPYLTAPGGGGGGAGGFQPVSAPNTNPNAIPVNIQQLPTMRRK